GISFGKTLVQRNMTPRAIDVFTQAFKFSKTPLVLQEEVADFCCNNGAGEYAASLLKKLISQLPQRTDLFFKLGKTWESLGDVNKALPYLIEAEKNDDANPEIKLHLAQDYITLGKPIWAERALKRLLKIDPDHKEAQKLLKSCVKT
ncbi:MAG: tetratricopeptide repeat protein, partial [Desulfobacterales bacterium]|nr:tetratricopeptide repeat protein [Candidatus Desulfatibia vada]